MGLRCHVAHIRSCISAVCASLQAEFTDATTLQLTRVTTSVQYHDTYMHGARAAPACLWHALACMQPPFASQSPCIMLLRLSSTAQCSCETRESSRTSAFVQPLSA
jgi:hypothetical protein